MLKAKNGTLEPKSCDCQKRLNDAHQSRDEESQQPVQSQVYLPAMFPALFLIPFIIHALLAAFEPLSMTRTPFISKREGSVPEDRLFDGRNQTKTNYQLGKRCVPLRFSQADVISPVIFIGVSGLSVR